MQSLVGLSLRRNESTLDGVRVRFGPVVPLNIAEPKPWLAPSSSRQLRHVKRITLTVLI